MSQATHNGSLKGALEVGLAELKEDAQAYLEQLSALDKLDPESEAYGLAVADLHVSVTALMAHSTSANDLLHEMDDADE